MVQKEHLTTADIQKLLDAADNAAVLVAFRLMCECGLKVGEVVTLRSLHVTYNRGGRFWLDVGRDKVACNEDLAIELLNLESDPDLPLVRYDASTIWRHLRRAARRAGVGKEVSNKTLRYYWMRSVANSTPIA